MDDSDWLAAFPWWSDWFTCGCVCLWTQWRHPSISLRDGGWEEERIKVELIICACVKGTHKQLWVFRFDGRQFLSITRINVHTHTHTPNKLMEKVKTYDDVSEQIFEPFFTSRTLSLEKLTLIPSICFSASSSCLTPLSHFLPPLPHCH